jgi:hypothetical protein
MNYSDRVVAHRRDGFHLANDQPIICMMHVNTYETPAFPPQIEVIAIAHVPNNGIVGAKLATHAGFGRLTSSVQR